MDTKEKIDVEDIMIDGNSVGDIGELVLKDREMLKRQRDRHRQYDNRSKDKKRFWQVRRF